MSNGIKLYAISGLGADYRVFQFVNLNAELIHLNWIQPGKEESLQQYTHRLAKKIDTTEPFGLMGVSFGGLIATEIAKKWHREFAILISSTDVTKGLPKIYGWVGKLGVLKLIPSACFQIPKWMANLLFGAKNKRLLSDILDDSDVDFTKWALKALTTWKNETPIINGLKINGTKDVLIPGRKDSHTQFVESGTHFMIVDRADEVSDLVNSFLKNQVAK